jgi:serine/threonine protein kinase
MLNRIWPEKLDSRYTATAVLHHGSRFVIVKARSDDNVVIKVPSTNSLLPVAKLRKHLKCESKALLALKHGGVVRPIEFDDSGEYLVFEYLSGGSLADIRCNHKWRAAFECTAKLADALDALHNAGYLHLDLKPRNIVFRDAPRCDPVIIDFGGARRLERPILADTIDKSMLGSRSYLFKAPEQLMHITERFTPQTDMFGLGATLYWLLFGKSPAENSEVSPEKARRKFDEDYRRAIERCRSENLPAEVINLLERTLVFEMYERELSAVQVRDRLRICASLPSLR